MKKLETEMNNGEGYRLAEIQEIGASDLISRNKKNMLCITQNTSSSQSKKSIIVKESKKKLPCAYNLTSKAAAAENDVDLHSAESEGVTSWGVLGY